MMKALLLSMLISSITPLMGQDTTIFAPLGSKFSYSTWVQVPYPELLTFVSDGDTVLNNIQARILRFYQTVGNELLPVDSLDKYVYTEGNKVFYWVEDGFYLLYDFGARPGDTIKSRVESFPISLSCYTDFHGGPFNFSYIIDSLGLIEIDGQSLRTQYISNIYTVGDTNFFIESPIVERLGQVSYSCFWWGRGSACLLGGFPGGLRCYEDQDIYFENHTEFDLECDYISSTEPVAEIEIPLYPNPVIDIIHLNAIAETIRITSLQGQLIEFLKNQDRIDASTLPPGIYFIQYQMDRKWFVEKFYKM